jgi:hypothetical protein
MNVYKLYNTEYMTTPILSEEIYNNPAKFEYFVRFVVAGNDNGKKSNFKLKTKSGYLADYCGKIFKGETLEQATKRELLDSFGVSESKILKINDKQEFAFNKFGKELPRVVIQIRINRDQFKINNFKGMSIVWIDNELNEKETTDSKPEGSQREFLSIKMSEYEKDLLVIDLYRAGAEDILTTEINFNVFDSKMGITTIPIPSENNQKILELLSSYAKKVGSQFDYDSNKKPVMVSVSWS